MNTKTKLGLVLGLCFALVAITYATNLLPSYAPGQNPPSLAQAPLIYQMAGVVDPATFDPATESLQAISDSADEILSKIANLASSTSSGIQIATGGNYTLVLIDGVVYATGNNTCGQLGDGTQTDRTNFVRVADGAIAGGNQDIDAIAASGGISDIASSRMDSVVSGVSATYSYYSYILKDGVIYSFGGSLSDRNCTCSGSRKNCNATPVISKTFSI